jgi:beta-mannosidase
LLALDGLDTFAKVKLNEDVILESDNMFIPHRIDVTDKLRQGGDNFLEIEFSSALLKARKIRDSHPEHVWKCSNGENARLAVRKAQYHWGWDWGPVRSSYGFRKQALANNLIAQVLMTCGPWKPVRLEYYDTRIRELWSDISLGEDLKSATINAHTLVEGSASSEITFALKLNGKEVAKSYAHTGNNQVASVELKIDSPALWYPHGYGTQPLYELSATLGQDIHKVSHKIGIRKAELVQEADVHGKSFYFRMNNVDVFCGGSNWIPADSLTPRISDAKYRRWLELMVDGNQCMVRIWGGGIWEPNVFFEICDELGIMVWQDFLFGECISS